MWTSFVYFLFLLGSFVSLLLCCTDEKGRSVDYYVIYKIPKLENSPNVPIRSGYGYAFVSSNDASKWKLSNQSINNPQSFIGNTLKSLYQSGNGNNFILYNDQPPKDYNSSSRSSLAHAKGIFVLNNNSGFWLAHSVPRFPDLLKNNYEYPESGRQNGQILICISLSRKDTDTIINIGRHLLLMKPSVYSSKYNQDFVKEYSIFKDLIDKKWTKNLTQISSIYSNNRVNFTIFSKSNKYQKDIYSQLIAPFAKEDLLVQTWRNGAGEKLDSDCKDQYKIMNIDQIKLNSNIDWKYTEDHAKWAVSVQAKDKETFTCVSDLNRMKSQFNRGGGSICFHSPNMWSALNSSVENVEPCPLKQSRTKAATKVQN